MTQRMHTWLVTILSYKNIDVHKSRNIVIIFASTKDLTYAQKETNDILDEIL